MTQKEKARELVDKFFYLKSHEEVNGSFIDIPMAKKCALLCVDEIIDTAPQDGDEFPLDEYWKKVKEEIENL